MKTKRQNHAGQNDGGMLFTCAICGADFEPTPDAMVEAGWDPAVVPIDEEGSITGADLLGLSAEELARQGLTPETLDQLLSGEPVETAVCICLTCQTAAASENEPEEGEEWKGAK